METALGGRGLVRPLILAPARGRSSASVGLFAASCPVAEGSHREAWSEAAQTDLVQQNRNFFAGACRCGHPASCLECCLY